MVDSSAVIAVLEGEPGADRIAELALGSSCRMSVANWVEAAVVADSRSDRTRREFDEVVELMGIELEQVTPAHGRLARAAFRRYGRGSGHPARLNVGDCFAYAHSVLAAEPLLFAGGDFAQTDVDPARW